MNDFKELILEQRAMMIDKSAVLGEIANSNKLPTAQNTNLIPKFYF